MITDHLGSTSITANADGTWNSEIRYSAFGEIRYTSGVTPTNYRYTGQLGEPSLGLDYYVARWYDPSLARFISPDNLIPDPTKTKSYDRYSYVENNPVRYNDPKGHIIPIIAIAIITAIIIPWMVFSEAQPALVNQPPEAQDQDMQSAAIASAVIYDSVLTGQRWLIRY